jgi:hypothetical protein
VLEAYAALETMYQSVHAEHPEIRAQLRTIAADELEHAQLAMDVGAWIASQLPANVNSRCADEVARSMVALESLTEHAAPRALVFPDASSRKLLKRELRGYLQQQGVMG